MAKRSSSPDLARVLHSVKTPFNPRVVANLFSKVERDRVFGIAEALSRYAVEYVPRVISQKGELADYRISPYVLLACANLMGLRANTTLGQFIVDTKLYTSLETSFGKQIESTFVGFYPAGARSGYQWADAEEKVREANSLKGLTRDEKAARRRVSVWREVDKACVVGKRRYLISIKSGPQCINDTQVSEMQRSIREHYRAWMESSNRIYGATALDIVIGLTYGTPATTNNKENQILIKLRDSGFEEEDRDRHPGVLIDSATRRVRVYRVIGMDFWAFIGNPSDPQAAMHTFIEALLALTLAMSHGRMHDLVESAIKRKGLELVESMRRIVGSFPPNAIPEWARSQLTDEQQLQLALSISAFFDQSGL